MLFLMHVHEEEFLYKNIYSCVYSKPLGAVHCKESLAAVNNVLGIQKKLKLWNCGSISLTIADTSKCKAWCHPLQRAGVGMRKNSQSSQWEKLSLGFPWYILWLLLFHIRNVLWKEVSPGTKRFPCKIKLFRMIKLASYSRELQKNLIEWLDVIKMLKCLKHSAPIVLQYSCSNFGWSLCLLQEGPDK